MAKVVDRNLSSRKTGAVKTNIDSEVSSERKAWVPASWEVDFGSLDKPKHIVVDGKFTVKKEWDDQRQHCYLSFVGEKLSFKVFPTATGTSVRMTNPKGTLGSELAAEYSDR